MKRPVFLLSAEGKSKAQLKAEAPQGFWKKVLSDYKFEPQ